MADDIDHDSARPTALLRLATLVIGSIEIIVFILFAHLMLQSADPLAESIGEAVTLLMAAPLLGLTLPGLLLAWLDRAPRTSLGLVLLAIPVAALAWLRA
ncbi:hypothetical protein [Hyphomicrobium sp.]|uniref:hypothetical protein n=1 Tax=Hyphomicrobium sp. TaxID=82 RepID=UPI002E353268|nr:hypothetical protein [Hyphomicrobium sp.]HEX2843442.1 hypothetical protein [Hyphomicrobium sp.]